jgi:hypothetical protein
LTDAARAFLAKLPGWEEVDQWIREERDSYSQQEDETAQTFMVNVQHEVAYAEAIWVGDYQRALEQARACADRLGVDAHGEYRAWWYYLAGSASALCAAAEESPHLRTAAGDLFARACAAAPTATWFREVTRFIGYGDTDETIDDPLLISASEAIERRIQQAGVVGAAFENEVQDVSDKLNSSEATTFEQGLELLGLWLGIIAIRPRGRGVPDGVWSFGEAAAVAFEAKSNEQPEGPISLSTAREARGHINWIKSNVPGFDLGSISTVVVSDRTTVSGAAVPNAEGLSVVSLAFIRELGTKVLSTIRALRVQASAPSDPAFRRVIADRLVAERLDPVSIRAALLGNPLGDFPIGD